MDNKEEEEKKREREKNIKELKGKLAKRGSRKVDLPRSLGHLPLTSLTSDDEYLKCHKNDCSCLKFSPNIYAPHFCLNCFHTVYHHEPGEAVISSLRSVSSDIGLRSSSQKEHSIASEIYTPRRNFYTDSDFFKSNRTSQQNVKTKVQHINRTEAENQREKKHNDAKNNKHVDKNNKTIEKSDLVKEQVKNCSLSPYQETKNNSSNKDYETLQKACLVLHLIEDMLGFQEQTSEQLVELQNTFSLLETVNSSTLTESDWDTYDRVSDVSLEIASDCVDKQVPKICVQDELRKSTEKKNLSSSTAGIRQSPQSRRRKKKGFYDTPVSQKSSPQHDAYRLVRTVSEEEKFLAVDETGKKYSSWKVRDLRESLENVEINHELSMSFSSEDSFPGSETDSPSDHSQGGESTPKSRHRQRKEKRLKRRSSRRKFKENLKNFGKQQEDQEQSLAHQDLAAMIKEERMKEKEKKEEADEINNFGETNNNNASNDNNPSDNDNNSDVNNNDNPDSNKTNTHSSNDSNNDNTDSSNNKNNSESGFRRGKVPKINLQSVQRKRTSRSRSLSVDETETVRIYLLKARQKTEERRRREEEELASPSRMISSEPPPFMMSMAEDEDDAAKSPLPSPPSSPASKASLLSNQDRAFIINSPTTSPQSEKAKAEPPSRSSVQHSLLHDLAQSGGNLSQFVKRNQDKRRRKKRRQSKRQVIEKFIPNKEQKKTNHKSWKEMISELSAESCLFEELESDKGKKDRLEKEVERNSRRFSEREQRIEEKEVLIEEREKIAKAKRRPRKGSGRELIENAEILIEITPTEPHEVKEVVSEIDDLAKGDKEEVTIIELGVDNVEVTEVVSEEPDLHNEVVIEVIDVEEIEHTTEVVEQIEKEEKEEKTYSDSGKVLGNEALTKDREAEVGKVEEKDEVFSKKEVEDLGEENEHKHLEDKKEVKETEINYEEDTSEKDSVEVTGSKQEGVDKAVDDTTEQVIEFEHETAIEVINSEENGDKVEQITDITPEIEEVSQENQQTTEVVEQEKEEKEEKTYSLNSERESVYLKKRLNKSRERDSAGILTRLKEVLKEKPVDKNSRVVKESVDESTKESVRGEESRNEEAVHKKKRKLENNKQIEAVDRTKEKEVWPEDKEKEILNEEKEILSEDKESGSDQNEAVYTKRKKPKAVKDKQRSLDLEDIYILEHLSDIQDTKTGSKKEDWPEDKKRSWDLEDVDVKKQLQEYLRKDAAEKEKKPGMEKTKEGKRKEIEEVSEEAVIEKEKAKVADDKSETEQDLLETSDDVDFGNEPANEQINVEWIEEGECEFSMASRYWQEKSAHEMTKVNMAQQRTRYRKRIKKLKAEVIRLREKSRRERYERQVRCEKVQNDIKQLTRDLNSSFVALSKDVSAVKHIHLDDATM